MNQKGQVLVVFILLIPLIILFMFYIYDIGNLYYQKSKLKSALKDGLTYSLNDGDDKGVINLIKENVLNVKVNIEKQESQTKVEGIIQVDTKLLKKQTIKITLIGKIEEDKIKIWEE